MEDATEQDQLSIEQRLSVVEDEVSAIHKRNQRVQVDKAWEVSKTRRGLIVLGTYCITALVFWLIGVEHFFRNAAIPTVGYILSTLSLSIARRFWTGGLSR